MFKISSSKPRSNSRFMSQCKKHPKHRQSPGVCSLCLSEKLSRVSSSSFSSSGSRVKRARAYYCSSSSLSSSEDESSYASSCASPDARDAAGGYYHRRIASDVMRQEMRRSDDVDDRFGKSRSMMRSGESKNSNVISGFWSKLLRPRKSTSSHLNKMISQSQPLAASSSSMAVC